MELLYAQYLHAGIVIAVKERHPAAAASRLRVLRTVGRQAHGMTCRPLRSQHSTSQKMQHLPLSVVDYARRDATEGGIHEQV
jgi:hypothetical protein